jgi:hypothetical protein
MAAPTPLNTLREVVPPVLQPAAPQNGLPSAASIASAKTAAQQRAIDAALEAAKANQNSALQQSLSDVQNQAAKSIYVARPVDITP